jgi:putative OPT family oligopeptide transporter
MAEEKGGLKYKPYVPANTNMKEFTIQALLLGLVMCVVLGAANAYLGLKAGMTIAATYPAAVIGMAFLRLFKGNILEENMARTVGSIGESVAAGAIFTVPAFMIAGVWHELRYWEATAIMLVGGIIGILFVTMLRRVMVEDVDLPYPESVAAGEIHKAGRTGGTGAIYLLLAGLMGAVIQVFKELSFFAKSWEHFVHFAQRTINLRNGTTVTGSGGALLSTPGVSPAYMGVGYIIGPKLASLNFSGGLLAWGLFVPVLLYFLGPSIEARADGAIDWVAQATGVWRYIVRPIAIGGMLLSACFTLFRMRNSLFAGMKRSIGDLRKAATGGEVVNRIERDIPFKWVVVGILGAGVATFFLYDYFAQDVVAALVATLVMIVAGFFFAAVSGYLVGMIGSSNNPISGLTLSTVIVAALLMYALGQSGTEGIAAVLGVAGVICVSAAVAGEMLQDLKVGHILGGTPWKMQVGDIIGVILAAAVMFWPILVLHEGDMAAYRTAHDMAPDAEVAIGLAGLGGPNLPAPQAGLMAMVSQGIIGGEMAWPLIVVGMLMALALILVQVKSPMLVCVGMYLPLETTFAIFIGGLFRGVVDMLAARRKMTEGQLARIENNGVLLSSGLIAGEALVGLVFAALAFREVQLPVWFAHPAFWKSIGVFVAVGVVLILVPLLNAGDPKEPAVKAS